MTQNTGFPHWLKADGGVVPFRTPDEAVEGIVDVSARYEHHCRRAREIGVEYFDARSVLRDLIDRAQTSAPLSAQAPSGQRPAL